METLAQHRHARSSAQKVRLVADLIRGKKVSQALDILTYTNKKARRRFATSNTATGKGIAFAYFPPSHCPTNSHQPAAARNGPNGIFAPNR